MRSVRSYATLCVALAAGVACEAPTPQTAPPPAAFSTAESQELQLIKPGRWRAANAQANQLVGNLSIQEIDPNRGEITLAFTHGVTVWARPAALPTEDAAIRRLVEDMRTALGAPADTFPTPYRVLDERIAPSAPSGGLCGGLRTRVVALAAFDDEDGTPVMRLAAFHQGFEAPTPQAKPEALKLCFAFDFSAWPDAAQ